MKTFTKSKNRYPGSQLMVALLLFLAFSVVSSCKKDSPPLPDATSENAQAGIKEKADITVEAGCSIQEAVDKAKAGDVIKIKPGVYKQTVLVDKPGITIKGTGNVVIKNPDALANGITVRANSAGFTLENVTIQGFERNGIILIGVNGFSLRKVIAIDNGAYGLFPIRCSNGKIEHCTASGHSDTGIYVGQSTDVEISHCTAFANVLGIEVENCSRVKVTQNHTYDNVTGILAVLLPQLLLKESSEILISKNIVTDNNHVNFAPPGSGFETVVPSGIGILIVGTDRTTVEQNQIKDNDFLGIGIFSTSTLGQLTQLPPLDIEPNADLARVVNNNLVNNATGQSPLPFLPAVDLIWDGTGNGNCWQGNNFITSAPSPLPTCN